MRSAGASSKPKLASGISGTVVRPRRVRTLLALMSLALVLPAFGFTTYLVRRSALLDQQQVEQRLSQVSADLADSIDRELERMLALLDTLALLEPLVRRDFAAFHTQASGAVRRLGAAIIVADPSMQQLVNTRVPYGTTLPGIADPGPLREAQTSRAPVVSNLVSGAVAQRYVFNIVLPLTGAGLHDHTLILALNADHWLKIMEGQKLPGVWVTGISDRRGIIVARSKDHKAFVGKSLPANLLKSSREEVSAFATVNVEGNRTMRAVAQSKVSGWLVSGNVPQSVVDAEIRRSFWSLAIGGLILLALAVTLAAFFARWIIAPMQALAASVVSQKGFNNPLLLASPVIEVNDVASALRTATVELTATAASLRESEQRLVLAQRTAGMTHLVADLKSNIVVASETFEEIFGFRLPNGDVSKVVQEFAKRVHPDDRIRAAAAQEQAAKIVGTYAYEFRVVRPSGELRWISAHGETFGDPAGNPVRLIETNLDITHRKEQEEHIRFLLREVSHRSKNLLAIIQAIATQTARTSRSIDVFRARFIQRLQGIAASQDLLVNQNWEGVSLSALVHAQLRPFAEDIGGRLEVIGPNITLKPDAAQSLGLALHELATNATKYGALSNDDGKVRISWTITQRHDAMRFHLEWCESGGPSVNGPFEKGFGHTVYDRMISAALKAKVDLRYQPGGVVWSLDATIGSVSEMDHTHVPEKPLTT